MNATPGVAPSAFCDPPTQTSIPQPSTSSSTAPTLEIASTTKSLSRSFTTLAMGSMSLHTPVDVSECWMNTALMPGLSSRALATSSGLATCPQL